MIKVECSKGSGTIQMQGDFNIQLNELEQLVKYMVMLHKDVALNAITNGITEAVEVLNEKN